MGIFAWIILGGIVGAIARLLFAPRNPAAWFATFLVTIPGAVIGGWIGARIWGAGMIGGYRSLVLAIVGAVVLLWVYRRTVGRQAKTEDTHHRRAA